MTETSLRERSKARRRAAITEAALSLFAERGYEQTTLADVAERAEVAPRTISLYFASKLDLALVYASDSAARFEAALAERTEEETTLQVFHRFVEGEVTQHDAQRSQHQAMIRANPALRGVQVADVRRAKRMAGRQLAKELGRSEDDVAVLLVGAALDGVLQALLEHPHDAERALELAIQLLGGLFESARATSAAPV